MDDLISRQAVLTMLDDIEDEVMDGEGYQYGKWSEYVEQLPAAQPTTDEWCTGCKEYDQKNHCCHRFTKVILQTVEELKAQSQWIPVTERLPENRVSVIICYREWQQYAKRYVYSIVIGWYARKHSVNENVFCEWDDDCDYDEDDDEYYIKEGWYEFTTQGNSDLMNWFINAEVVAWMPLPEPYRGEEK